jgi:hypothetical protein
MGSLLIMKNSLLSLAFGVVALPLAAALAQEAVQTECAPSTTYRLVPQTVYEQKPVKTYRLET